MMYDKSLEYEKKSIAQAEKVLIEKQSRCTHHYNKRRSSRNYDGKKIDRELHWHCHKCHHEKSIGLIGVLP